jgi:hypothetical protein
MKKLLLTIIILMISIPVSASMSKLYVGDENGQFIFGIASTVANEDGAVGGEIRTYLAKKGIEVNGIEYGSLPSRTKYNFHLAGKNENGVLRYDRNVYVNHKVGATPRYSNNAIALKGGISPYLFYE